MDGMTYPKEAKKIKSTGEKIHQSLNSHYLWEIGLQVTFTILYLLFHTTCIPQEMCML